MCVMEKHAFARGLHMHFTSRFPGPSPSEAGCSTECLLPRCIRFMLDRAAISHPSRGPDPSGPRQHSDGSATGSPHATTTLSSAERPGGIHPVPKPQVLDRKKKQKPRSFSSMTAHAITHHCRIAQTARSRIFMHHALQNNFASETRAHDASP